MRSKLKMGQSYTPRARQRVSRAVVGNSCTNVIQNGVPVSLDVIGNPVQRHWAV